MTLNKPLLIVTSVIECANMLHSQSYSLYWLLIITLAIVKINIISVREALSIIILNIKSFLTFGFWKYASVNDQNISWLNSPSVSERAVTREKISCIQIPKKWNKIWPGFFQVKNEMIAYGKNYFCTGFGLPEVPTTFYKLIHEDPTQMYGCLYWELRDG